MKLIQDFIPIGIRRPGSSLIWSTITIHNTANPRSDARRERLWLTNPMNTRLASWHYCVWEDEIVQAIPETEVAFHSGTRKGNNTSLSIEICESGNYEKTVETAIDFIVDLLLKHTKGAEILRTHFYWNGKNCPRLILPVWDEFVEKVKILRSREEERIFVNMNKLKETEHFALPAWEFLNSIGIRIFEQRFNDNITRGELFSLLARIYSAGGRKND